MMASQRNKYLDAGFSDESDHGDGYDSEAAELSKGRGHTQRPTKRRKLSSANEDDGLTDVTKPHGVENGDEISAEGGGNDDGDIHISRAISSANKDRKPQTPTASTKLDSSKSVKKRAKEKEETPTPGVIYLSSLPPYLKPSALRNLLAQRGFTPITRLFLTPSSKAKSTSKRNSRQLYSEGWIEFESKKTARRCAETLNASVVGGKKGGFYHDDVWNMRYLKGMRWAELMAGIREEKREEEGRRDDERRRIARDTKAFVEGVEEGRKVEGMKRKRRRRDGEGEDQGGGRAGEDIKRTWRQFEVKGDGVGSGKSGGKGGAEKIDDDVKRVLGKIF